MKPSQFDASAGRYAEELDEGLRITGENIQYYAQRRIGHLARCLGRRGFQARRVLDFGCGTGTATPYFLEHFPGCTVTGANVSNAVAGNRPIALRRAAANFIEIAALSSCEGIDLAFCNGVFHHIPLPERPAALQTVRRCLRPQGLFAFWENNPWNPGTRWVMSRVAFDRDAVCISPPEARHLLRDCGFVLLQVDYLFIFPRWLRAFRALENLVRKLPLGGQYQVLCRKAER